MAITTRDQLIAAQATAQSTRIFKTGSRTTVATIPFSMFEIAGDPGAGVLAGTSTTAGVVPTDLTAGCPILNPFGGSNTGYVSRVEASNTLPARLAIYDMVWKGGAYAFNANVTLSAQPSYSSRMPGGTDYKSTQIWLETVTAFTGNQSIRIQYLDQGGNAGDTGTIATGITPTIGRMYKMPFQSGDTGVQRIDVVTSTVSTVGTFNVLVLNKIWEGRIRLANDQIVHGPDLTGLPQVFADAALILVVTADATGSGNPEVVLDIING